MCETEVAQGLADAMQYNQKIAANTLSMEKQSENAIQDKSREPNLFCFQDPPDI
jgi:hypothetical protein